MFEYDLADRVDDLICTFENGNPDSDMDTITILLTGWITFLFVSVLLLKFIYRKCKGKTKEGGTTEPLLQKQKEPSGLSPSKKFNSPASFSVNGATEKHRPTFTARLTSDDQPAHLEPPLLKQGVVNDNFSASTPVVKDFASRTQADINDFAATSIPDVKNFSSTTQAGDFRNTSNSGVKNASSSVSVVPTLKCSGPSTAIVEFVTAAHKWLYVDGARRDKISKHVNDLFLKSVNKIFHGIPHEDTFVATVDDLSLSNDLSLRNLFAEYEGTAIKITCDCQAKFAGHLSLSPQSSGQDERHYEFIVNRFIGRLKFLVQPQGNAVTFKFDGWPEICLSIANTSKEAGRLDPKFSEIITSKLSSALRNATVEIHLDELENFPDLPKASSKASRKETQYLRIQLNGGVDIALHKDCDSAYCVIELDDPAQKFQSRPKNLPNPIWNESFVLNTGTDGDAELLFEVYSSLGGTFLGCHFVSVDEIVDGKTEILRLKSRRVKVAENITGTIEVVFTFINEREATKYIAQEVNKVIGKREQTQPGFDPTSSVKVIPVSDGDFLMSEVTPPVRPPRHSKLEDQYGEERGRRRTRRGDVFTSIRRRFSKERSKSVAHPDPLSPDMDDRSTRSLSVDRPAVRAAPLGSDSTSSSASELSQHSNQSTTTFMHESSTLLIQCTENGVKRYYLLPPEELASGKWRNGKKLHIFNDHTFVAKRIQSGLSCTVCFGRFPFSLRKQGYQCRDCRLISHKECHIRIPTFCVKSKIYDIDVITL